MLKRLLLCLLPALMVSACGKGESEKVTSSVDAAKAKPKAKAKAPAKRTITVQGTVRDANNQKLGGGTRIVVKETGKSVLDGPQGKYKLSVSVAAATATLNVCATRYGYIASCQIVSAPKATATANFRLARDPAIVFPEPTPPSTPPANGPATCTSSGPFTNCSDGTTWTTSGPFTNSSGGVTCTKSGPFSNCSNGVTCTKSGPFTNCSDGSTCTTSGPFTNCTGGFHPG